MIDVVLLGLVACFLTVVLLGCVDIAGRAAGRRAAETMLAKACAGCIERQHQRQCGSNTAVVKDGGL